ncbi:DUF859 family phage minor structural protein [Streptococcus oralis]|uniref:DUF859 family phage minor structural protein n=1 Tax=Streptococcus oralis TaxID=1303 RepID=UPI0039C3AE15
MTKFINSSGPLHLNIYIEQVSQDIANNSSRVSWRATVDRDGRYRTWNAENGSVLSVWLNGSSVYKSNLSFETEGQETTLASGEATIPHNSDGTKTMSVWASFDANNGIHGNITISTNYTFDKIPRSTQISSLEGNRNLGSLHTVIFNRKVNSFTHQVWYRVFGSEWIDLGKNHGTSVSFTPSLDLARHLPKSSSGLMDICVRTYNGSTQIGSDVYSNGWHFKIPDSVKPTFTGLSLTDMNTVARRLLSGNDFLQIISDIQVNFNNASGAYGSTITGYRAEIVNKKMVVTKNGGSFGIMNFSGLVTIRAHVVDSRGKQSDIKDVTINVIEYYAPSFSFSALRTRGNPNTLQVLRNARIAPIMQSGKQRNVMSLTFKVAQIGNENFTDDNGSASGNFTSVHTLTNSAANMGGNYPSNKSFVIIGKLEDKFTSVEFSTTVATESVVMSYDKNGRVGIGKVAEFGKPGSLDVKGDIYANNQPIQQYRLTDNIGGLSRGSAQWDDVWNKQGTEFGWRNGKYADNPTGNDWGLFQNYWLDSWKGVQFFTGVTSNRVFFRTYNNDTRWAPSQWREVATIPKTVTKKIDAGWGVKLNAIRNGNTITLSTEHVISNINTESDYRELREILPAGFRPAQEAHLVLQAHSGSTVEGTAILHMAPDGKIRLTSRSPGNKYWTGTITYITSDPYP